MACDLEPTCNFLGYFSCTLPEDTIDVDITGHSLKGIIPSGNIEAYKYLNAVHGVWKSNQMLDYIEECQTIANPVTIDLIPQGLIPHDLQKGLKPSLLRELMWLPGTIMKNCQN